MDNVGGGVGFTNIDALPEGKLLQVSYGKRRKGEGVDRPKIKNKSLVRKMMANMPAPTKLDNMTAKE